MKNWAGSLFYFIATIGVILTAAALIQIRDIAEYNQRNTNLLIECNTPPGDRNPPITIDPTKKTTDCYTRYQQNIVTINDISVAAAACGAANPGNVPATRNCVTKVIESNKPNK